MNMLYIRKATYVIGRYRPVIIELGHITITSWDVVISSRTASHNADFDNPFCEDLDSFHTILIKHYTYQKPSYKILVMFEPIEP
jgi:hypothetical protein